MRSLDAALFIDAVVQMISSTRDLLGGFRGEVRRNISSHFVDGIESVVDAVEAFHANRLKFVEASTADPSFKEEQNRFFSQVCLQLLLNVHEEYLPLLYASRQNNEYLILPSINRAIKWFKPDVELTLLPSFRFNYTYNGGLENFVEKTIERLEQFLDAAHKGAVRSAVKKVPARWITFIHFPMAHRDSALHLVVISHEVGHLIDQTCDLYKKFFPITLDNSTFSGELERLCKIPLPLQSATGPALQLTFESVWGRATIEANFTKQCVLAVENWTREVIADTLAIHLLGPAYLFAFQQLMAYGGDEPSDSHPAPSYRIDLMLEELRIMGYFDKDASLNMILSAIKAEVTANLPLISYKDNHLVAQRTIEKVATKIQTELRAFVSSHSYRYEQYKVEVPEVLKLLLGGIAPVEILDHATNVVNPAGVTAIINAGWELHETRIDDFYRLFRADVVQTQRLGNLNELLFKAIEASEVVRLWRNI